MGKPLPPRQRRVCAFCGRPSEVVITVDVPTTPTPEPLALVLGMLFTIADDSTRRTEPIRACDDCGVKVVVRLHAEKITAGAVAC